MVHVVSCILLYGPLKFKVSFPVCLFNLRDTCTVYDKYLPNLVFSLDTAERPFLAMPKHQKEKKERKEKKKREKFGKSGREK